MYRDGLGVERNKIEAHKWFNLANARGNDKAALAQAEIEVHMTQDQIAQSQKLPAIGRQRIHISSTAKPTPTPHLPRRAHTRYVGMYP
jgi:TPR repeat protein